MKSNLVRTLEKWSSVQPLPEFPGDKKYGKRKPLTIAAKPAQLSRLFYFVP
jgi:hypothetical protein